MTAGRLFAKLVLALVALPLPTQVVGIENYPAKPVKMIVPYQAGGGGLDTMARLIAQRLSERAGQRFYIENIPGAGGSIGIAAAARATPDGYTAAFINQDFVIQPLVKKTAAYEPLKDFAPVTLTASGKEAIIINPSLPAQNMRDLLRLLKENPGRYSYATPGYGTSPHLASERLFRLSHGLDVVHVPFQGGAPAVAATLAGHTQILHINLAVVAPYVRDSRLRVLAVADNTRAAAFPDIPTLAEAGVPGHEVGYWNGVVVPAATSRSLIDQLHSQIIQVITAADVRDRLAAVGFEISSTTPEAFAAYLARESAQWRETIQRARIIID
jgi:tripartite-type tricarboxylate transporter receptor subunit TctC